MAQPTFSQVRAALAGVLAGIPGVTGADTFKDITPPAAIVMPEQGQFMTYGVASDSSGGQVNWLLRVILLASVGDTITGQNTIDAMISTTGTQSVYAAIMANQTLGGVVSFCEPVEAIGYGLMQVDGIDYLACSVTVQIGA